MASNPGEGNNVFGETVQKCSTCGRSNESNHEYYWNFQDTFLAGLSSYPDALPRFEIEVPQYPFGTLPWSQSDVFEPSSFSSSYTQSGPSVAASSFDQAFSPGTRFEDWGTPLSTDGPSSLESWWGSVPQSQCHYTGYSVGDGHSAIELDQEQILPGSAQMGNVPGAPGFWSNGIAHSYSAADRHATQAFGGAEGWENQPQVPAPESELASTSAVAIPIRSSPRRRPSAENSSPTDTQRQTDRQSTASSIPFINYEPDRNNSDHLVSPQSTAASFSFVNYKSDPNKSNRLLAAESSAQDESIGKGRKHGLSPEQRRRAARMRHLGACANCVKRKHKCEEKTPCQACVDRYSPAELARNPCRPVAVSR